MSVKLTHLNDNALKQNNAKGLKALTDVSEAHTLQNQRFRRADSRTCVKSNIFGLLNDQFRRASAHFFLIYQ